MASLKTYLDVQALPRNGTAATGDAVRRLDEHGGPVVASSHVTERIPAMRAFVAVVLALWLAGVVLLGAGGAFVAQPGIPPYPVAIGVAAPLIAFLVALTVSAAFRRFVTHGDTLLVAAIQSWRWAGFSFIGLYVYGVLPGLFAWPAALGDMAIGLTAPLIVLALVRRPGFAASRRFVIWNLLGILDLVVAVSLAAIVQMMATGAPGEVTAAPMARLPLLLVPGFLVPLFIMLHLSALLQVRRAAKEAAVSKVG